MLNALDLEKNALTLWNKNHPGESLDQQCQRYTGYYTSWENAGSEAEIIVYPTATAAMQASTLQKGNINDAPVGSYLWWNNNHNGLVIGHDQNRAIVVYATRHGDTIQELGNGVKSSHADTYPLGVYQGYSLTNGGNVKLQPLSPWNMAYPAPPAPPTNPLKELLNTTAKLTGELAGALQKYTDTL